MEDRLFQLKYQDPPLNDVNNNFCRGIKYFRGAYISNIFVLGGPVKKKNEPISLVIVELCASGSQSVSQFVSQQQNLHTYEQTVLHNFATNKDPEIFRFIKEFTKSHILPPQLYNDSTTANTDSSKAELFNRYFHSVFTQSRFCLPDITDLPVFGSYLDSINFTAEEILETLKSLIPTRLMAWMPFPQLF